MYLPTLVYTVYTVYTLCPHAIGSNPLQGSDERTNEELGMLSDLICTHKALRGLPPKALLALARVVQAAYNRPKVKRPLFGAIYPPFGEIWGNFLTFSENLGQFSY